MSEEHTEREEERKIRTERDEERKDDYEDSAFQPAPHRGAWTGGWKDLPGQHSWLDLSHGPDHPPARTPKAERPDAEIEEDVARAVGDRGIKVSVAKGMVALDGEVGSMAAKLEAQRQAGAVRGVGTILNRLTVARRTAARP